MFEEPRPDVVSPNPGGPADPLGESVLDPVLPGLRVFQPADTRVVIGRAQDPAREVDLAACAQAGIPVHRRVSGGGTVVLAPGMVVVALRLAGGMRAADDWFALVNAALIAGVRDACPARLRCRGHGDLTLDGGDGAARKVLGASLRQTAARSCYLGVFLVDDAVPLMERYLAHPSREPSYRAGRGHRAFCDHLGRCGASVAGLVAALGVRLAPLIDASPGPAAPACHAP